MNEQLIKSKDYSNWLIELKKRYQNQQIKAAVKVNQELLRFYWFLGKDIAERQFENTYGSGFFQQLSKDLKVILPGVGGFSVNNLRYMRSFYLLYSNCLPNLQQPVDDLSRTRQNLQQAVDDLKLEKLFSIPWGHHIQIINKCNGDTERAWFYVQKTLSNGWSRAVLLNFLGTGLYEREGKAVSNFQTALPAVQSDLAQQITKDPYCFNFLTLEEPYHEKELKTALINNIQRFLLELGNGFAYMGREYRLQIGETEQFLDMLFYNVNLRCYVVIEVKTKEFSPEAMGQLGTYVVAVNHLLKKPGDNPTLGLLVCKNKDNILAKYALESSSLPIAVSEYELAKLYPADFKSSLPSIEEIECELERGLKS